MKRKRSPAPLWGAVTNTIIRIVSFAHKGRGLLLLFMSTTSFAQMTLTGRVVMPDSSAVAFANVTLLGEKQQTTASGRFSYEISEAMQKRLGVEIGDDLPILVEKEGLVVLQPANGRIRIPRKAMSQEIEIIMAKKGSPLLIKSEAVLENLIQQRVNAAILAEKGGNESLRDVLAEEALRLGLDKDQLREAMNHYKASLRKSEEAIKRGLAALDDANEAKEFKLKQQKLQEAKNNFHEAIHKDETASRAGREADKRLPESYYNLGLAYFNEARYDSAAFFFTRADSAEPNSADKLNMLGRALGELAQYDKAMQAYQRAFEIDTTTFGRNHPNVATRLNNIGVVLELKGDYARALEKLDEALQIDAACFGWNHPNVATQLSNIAGVLMAQGDYAGALGKFNESLMIDEANWGRNHPDVASDLNNIGEVLREKGDYEGALEKYHEALKILQEFYGLKHPHIAATLNNIALVLYSKGDYPRAMAKYNEALKIDRHYWGRNHPYVAIRLNNIAAVLEATGSYTEALEKYREALWIDTSYFGGNHPNVARDLNNIAVVLKTRRDYAGALKNLNEALRIDEARFDHNHPNVAIRLNNIGSALDAKGDRVEAMEKYDEALIIFLKFHGSDHPYTKAIVAKRMQILEGVPEIERWRYLTRSYLMQLSDSLRQSDRLILFLQIGQGYFKQAQVDSALAYVHHALLLAQTLGDSQTTGTILTNVGLSLKSLKHWTQAEQYLQQSLAHNRSVQGDSAAVLAYTYFHLAGVAHAQSQPARAREYAQKSLALAARHKLAELQKEVEALLREREK